MKHRFPVHDILRRIAEHLLPPRGMEHNVVDRIPVPETVVVGGKRKLPALLLGSNRRLGCLPAGNVLSPALVEADSAIRVADHGSGLADLNAGTITRIPNRFVAFNVAGGLQLYTPGLAGFNQLFLFQVSFLKLFEALVTQHSDDCRIGHQDLAIGESAIDAYRRIPEEPAIVRLSSPAV